MRDPQSWVVRPVRAVEWSLRSRAVLALASLVGLGAYLWPFVASSKGALSVDVAHSGDAALLMVGVLPLVLVLIGTELAEGQMDSRGIALLGVLTALGAVLRVPGGGVSGFSPMFFVVILAGRVFGAGFGFVLGALTMLGSALLTGGVGPWLPFQILGLAWMGMGAGLLPHSAGRAEVALLGAYGWVSGFVFGFLLNLWSWPFVAGTTTGVSFVPGAGVADNAGRYLAYYLATSLGWDLFRGAGNLIMVLTVGRPLLGALRRAGHRGAFVVR